MALLKNGKVVADPFTDISEAESIPADGAIIVSLKQWLEQKEALIGRKDPLGIVLQSDQKPTEIADDLEQFALVALEFPAFADGRAYSSARLLRDRYNFAGEVRAVGDVLLEQLHFMNRVGFDAFNINSNDAVHDWETAAADISVWYQPASDGRSSVIELRHQDK